MSRSSPGVVSTDDHLARQRAAVPRPPSVNGPHDRGGVPSSPLLVWWDDPAEACLNMAADEALAAESLRHGGPVVRFYGWMPTSVSLGAFQRLADARQVAAITGTPLVRRPSGGGAIVHGSDLTYAAAVPKGHPWGGHPQAFYDAFHVALVAELVHRGLAARRHEPGVGGGADGELFFCFDRRAVGDVVVARSGAPHGEADPKVLGSAQRRLAGCVLQHGSLLLRANMAVGPAARHAGLWDFLGTAGDPRELAEAWIGRLSRAAGLQPVWPDGGFLPGRRAELSIDAHRFADEAWTGRR